MEAKDTLFHINWGDGDNTFIIACDAETAKKNMPDGKDMVNYIVPMDGLYQMIYKAGIKEVIKYLKTTRFDLVWDGTKNGWVCDVKTKQWQSKLKEWGIKPTKE